LSEPRVDESVVQNAPVSPGPAELSSVVAERIRRPTPTDLYVLPESLPVVAFGDPDQAVVATLSLNPSWMEFQDQDGMWLEGSRRRLASLNSLGVSDPRELDDEQVASVVSESNGYFLGPNWYRGWFHWLESMLTVSGAGSYFDSTACHLDLVQWATKPAQGDLPADVWQRLVEEDRDFLRWQLSHTNVRVLFLNGASVVEWFRVAGLVDHFEADSLPYETRSGRAELRVYKADAEGVLVLGWNRPLAGALSTDGRLKLGQWLAEGLHARPTEVVTTETEAMTAAGEKALPQAFDLENGYVSEGSIVHSAPELERLLSYWISESSRPTIGDVGRFGGSPILTVRLGGDEFVLNRDTKRPAVRSFLDTAAGVGGAEHLRWHVTTNARGTANRVSYRTDEAPTPGWYAYVRGPSGQRDLG